MQKESRTDKLKNMIEERLFFLEKRLSLPPDKVDDKEYEEMIAEAIRLRDTLKMLK